MSRRPRAGFTIEEIIVALTIIGIGAVAILNFGQTAREIARTASCGSNVRQICLALRAYGADNDGRMPQYPWAMAATYPYAKSNQVWCCPGRYAPDGSPPAGYQRDDYLVNSHAQLDDLPGVLLVADDEAGRHLGKRWNGVRLDAALHIYPARDWQVLTAALRGPGTPGLAPKWPDAQEETWPPRPPSPPGGAPPQKKGGP
jgi:prepilin-type N-terminal cleavage/methylation domain-containing protein